MTNLTIPASGVRVPTEAREAVERGGTVTVTDRGRSAYVIMSPSDYALVHPMLERRRHGYPIPIESLLTAEDYAVMSLEDDSDDDALSVGILESWDD